MKRKLLHSLFVLLASGLVLSSCNAGMIDYDPTKPASTVQEVSLSEGTISLDVGASVTIDAFLSGGEDIEEVRWINSNKSIISLTPSQMSSTIVGLKAGTAYVSALAGDKMATCSVIVGGGAATIQSITLSDTAKTLDKGEAFNLTADIKFSGLEPAVTYATSNAAVATVTKQTNFSATVNAVGKGEATITVKAGALSATCAITVEEFDQNYFIKLDRNSLSLVEGNSATLVAARAPESAPVVWTTDNAEVATVDNGKVTAVKAGTANITASITAEGEATPKTAVCKVSVTSQGSSSEYEKEIAKWSKPGHLYLHYLRKSDTDYSKWALWIWQNYPDDSEGSLWGATKKYEQTFKGVVAETWGHMTNADCGGADNAEYVDEYGIIIDVDLTKEDLLSGKARLPAPLVTSWDDISRNALGFLIVDQTKMDGSDNWVSDGGAETYIKKLGSKMPEGKDSYLHVYCVEGNVAGYTTSSGQQEFVNPTATDKTGKYRSSNDITNLKYDAFGSGVSTSSSFKEDRPGTGYQIFVPSFADSDGDGFGDIKGITQKLDYLEDLGVEVLWLTPIQESNSYHGYDVTNYYKIDPKFGTLGDYQELIYKAHQKGMKVLMDMVINHTSKSNVLFQKSQKAEVGVSPSGKPINYRDMYLWKYEGDKVLQWNGVESTKKDSQGNPVAYGPDNPATFTSVNVEDDADWYRDGTSNYYYYGKFGSGMAELNYSCAATREYMTDMCKYWLSFGLDGFRLDAIKHIYLLSELDPSYNYSSDYITYDVGYRTYWDSEKVPHEQRAMNDYTYDRDLNVIFWKQFAGTIKSAYPNCFLVGENFDGWNERIAPFYEAMDSQFDFSTYYHLHESTASGIVAMGGDITATLNYNKAKRADHINGAFTSNHDVARFINHCASTVQSEHHAEVNDSNKALALKKARWDAAITLLCPGVSWIYYGDEIGLGGNTKDEVPDKHGNIYDDHGNNVDRWYRQPMRWGRTKGQDMVVDYTFGGIEILWDNYSSTLPIVSEQQADSTSLYNLFKALCHTKADDRYPTYGYIVNQWAVGSDQNVLCMQISDGVRKVNAFVNATDSNASPAAQDQGYAFIGGSAGASQSVIPANGFSVVAVNL